MKKLFLVFLGFVLNIFPQQKYYTFSELEGMEDNSDNTHLFYRLYWTQNYGNFQADDNSIYHLDLSNSIDSLFLSDYITIPSGGENRVLDFQFWNNDPSKYIYCGFSSVIDPVATIQRFDENFLSYQGMGSIDNVKISIQNDSLVFAGGFGYTIVSTDGGRYWDNPELTIGSTLISVSPFNDSILFVEDDNRLLKTTDKGKNFSIVDTAIIENYSFLYDKDELHVYRVWYSNYQYYLSVSNDKGNAFSWIKRYSDASKVFISLDYSQSGTIYLANNKYIYVSQNYGESFNLFKELDRDIVGIYKKTNSDLLYAATKYDLYEITSDTIKIIKHLPSLVGIEDKKNNLPTEFILSQNYPNPFNPTTKIKYAIPTVGANSNSPVQLKVYDILGNEIAVLVNNGQSPGEYEVEFDAGKYNLSSGIYFYQLKCGSFVQTKKLVLLK